MKTVALLAGLLCVALLCALVVDSEADVRRSAFAISRLERVVADRDNELAWLKNRVEARRARLVEEASMKRAGLAVARTPVRVVPPPVPGRPGS